MAEHEKVAPPPAHRKPSFLGLFRTGITSSQHRHYITVARQPMLEDALEHLRRSIKRKSKHHFLYIGGRGTGKSHLLSLIEDEIYQDDELRTHIAVARFPEASSRILSFADFLLRLCEILAIQFPAENTWDSLYQKLETEKDDAKIIDGIIHAIRQTTKTQKRTVLIILENFHDILETQMKERADVGALRKFLMDSNGCQLIATAPIHFEGISSVDEPFFDFFDVQVLDLLTKDESIELIRKNLEWEKRSNLLDDFKTLRPKLAALHDMTAGNARLTHMLYEMMVHEPREQIEETFQALFDRVTPVYQDRLKELAPRERALFETLALMRDESDLKTPKRIAEKLRISEQQTSSLLKRLTQSGYVKSFQNPKDKRSRLYSINEGFFDLWLAMNLSPKFRKRLPILLEFLGKFYSQREDHETKLDRDSSHAQNDNKVGHAERISEVRSTSTDSMGNRVVTLASSKVSQLEYLDEIEQMIELWTRHRCGDLEAFVERYAAMGTELNCENYYETKIGFMRDQLHSLTDQYQRIEVRLHLGKLLKERELWEAAETEYRHALNEAKSSQNQELLAQPLNELTELLLTLGKTEEDASSTIPANPKRIEQ